MLARRYGLVVVLLLIPIEARAHLHKAGAFFARSYDKGSNLGGFQLGGEYMLPRAAKDGHGDRIADEKETSWWSFFLNTSTNWGPHNGGDRTQFALSGGLRCTVPIPVNKQRFEVYGHVTGAFVHTQDSKPSTVDQAKGGGGGVGLTIDLRQRLHEKQQEVVAKVQYDLFGFNGRRPYKLVSMGIEYRFGSYSKPCPRKSTARGSSNTPTGGR